ncbi:MAG: DUF3307 domain-containing protein, partial [Methylocella sp.]
MDFYRTTTFYFFLLAHILTDYPLQTNTVARWKREKGLVGNFIHASVFVFASLALMTVWRPVPGFLKPVIGATLFICLVHGLLDFWRISYITRNRALDTMWTFLADQTLHLLSMAAAIWMFRIPPTAFVADPRPLLMFNGALLSAFGATVVLFYVRNMVDETHRYEMFSPYRRYFHALFAMVYFFLFYQTDAGTLAWFPYILVVNLAFNRLIVRHFSGEGEALFDT